MADVAKGLLKIVGGITLIVISVWIGVAATSWGAATLAVVKGGLLLSLIMAGLLLGLIGFTGLKD